ncbi:MAG: hypothetical protein GY851_09305 [bacterium]|nr:hypothetical protein [bacterium]
MKATQKQRLADYLKHHNGITSLEAARLSPPIMRLSERIREMERDGVRITKADVKHDGVGYVRYSLPTMPKGRGA